MNIEEIRKRHDETEKAHYSGSKIGLRMYSMLLPAAHKDRGELLKLVEELEAQNKRLTSRGFEDLHHENGELQDSLDLAAAALRLKNKRIEELEDAMRLIDPFLDQLVCYASTTTERKPNAHLRIFRAAIKGEGDA